MANFKSLTVGGKPTVINLDQIVYAERVGGSIRIVSAGSVVTTLDSAVSGEMDAAWNHLFPAEGSGAWAAPVN